MKFHCERCKTRYSIADDRVRGKILKIRCKNCSAVITVKEGGPLSEPHAAPSAANGEAQAGARSPARRRGATNSGSALQGAFEQALRRPQSMAPADAPAVLDAEWYVSQDGEQFGPFPLPKAQDWVAQRAAADELFCWSEGFDDWLPIEKVSHFRGLRSPAESPDSGLLVVPGRHDSALLESPAEAIHPEETPVPLFASTLAQVGPDPADDAKAGPMFARRNGSSVSQLGNLGGSRPPGPASPSPPAGHSSLFGPLPPAPTTPAESPPDASHDFEIGEASRVVKLDMLARQAGNASRSSPGLPGMAATAAAESLFGRGTGSHGRSGAFSTAHAGLPVVQGTTVETPRIDAPEPRRRSGLMMPLAIGAAIVAGVVSVLLYVALTGDGEDAHVRRGQVGGKGGLAYTLEPTQKKEGDDKPDQAAVKTTRRPARKVAPRGSTATATTSTPVGPSSDEVDLSGDAPRTGELDPGDLFDVYNANKIGVTMCFNSALKRDPLLAVKRADVLITVSPTGSVSSVSIPSLTGTPLGICLEKRIRSWKFPRATQIFTSRFPIIFQS